MSDVVLTALITGVAALIGAVAGAFGVIYSSKHSAESQLQKAVVEEYFKARLNAFCPVRETYVRYQEDMDSAERRLEFMEAISSACLVSSSATAHYLISFQEVVLSTKGAKFVQEAEINALRAMQKDLQVYMAPSIKKSKWEKS